MSEEEAKIRREASYLIHKKGWVTNMDKKPQSLELPPMPDWEKAEAELHGFTKNLFHDLGRALASGTVLAPSAWKEGLDESKLSSRHEFRDQWEALHARAIDDINNQDLELQQEPRTRPVDQEAIDRGDIPELGEETRYETKDEKPHCGSSSDTLPLAYNFVRLNQGKLGHPKNVIIPGLVTKLRPWQTKAVELMRDFIRGPHRGVILGDGMGLGKTLTVIALIMHLRLKKTEGPVLIVAPKGLHSTWLAECQYHFAEGSQPKVLVWDNSELTTSDLLGGDYDIEITSYHFVMHRIKELDFGTRVGHILLHGTKEEISVVQKLRRLPFEVARAVARPMTPSRMRWKFSAQLSRFSRILMLDEAYKVKNHLGETRQALHSLPYKRFVGITGTFMPNKWTDIYGMIDLLPGNPFDSYDHLVKSFGTMTHGRPFDRCNEAALTYYPDSLVVARPQSVLELEGIDEKMVEAPPQRINDGVRGDIQGEEVNKR
ncbi:hypothetical protein CH063_02095 [Colletotrichum higginsianum]|uniref:DNA repair protein rad16 n=1 Tax=Colletotrichum higginsianum (strain IMI 349063) TaxID=759273 RepID=H1VGA0_COLHI|nr:DNA repair protein rad16 [Colletotrichum higginsianum IMI 349063]OBR14119.1 DNA repair protein rad16 [Colletotrichum higginsianum IMI 349063]CCF39253.1 hypothetical protein CH063_02095 [Colletotrichum higginsianum]